MKWRKFKVWSVNYEIRVGSENMKCMWMVIWMKIDYVMGSVDIE